MFEEQSSIESFASFTPRKVKSEVKRNTVYRDVYNLLLTAKNEKRNSHCYLDCSTDSSMLSEESGEEYINEDYFVIKNNTYSHSSKFLKKKSSLRLSAQINSKKLFPQPKPKKQKSVTNFDAVKKMKNDKEIIDFNDYTRNCFDIIKQNNFFEKQRDKINKKLASYQLSEKDSNDIILGVKKLLVFDLDETLIHSETDEKEFKSCDKVVTVKITENKEKTIGVRVRPFINYCLNSLKDKFVFVIYTASTLQYTDAVLSVIDPDHKIFKYILCRHHCIPINLDTNIGGGIYYVKDLRIFGLPLEKIVIIDNSVLSFVFQIDNGIPILPFYANKTDCELYNLVIYLKHLSKFSNVIQANKKNLDLRGEIFL